MALPIRAGRVDVARQLATDNLDDADAEQANTEGQNLDWQAAAAYARRARGERKRPRHGWASLTPTEQQVVDLIADGLTNAQIAARLLMGQATVKTHLAHIFNKLGVRPAPNSPAKPPAGPTPEPHPTMSAAPGEHPTLGTRAGYAVLARQRRAW